MKQARLVATFCAAALAGLAATAHAQAVQLSIQDGRVTLKADQASIRQILAEWERLGQVKVVGVDRLAASQPLTLTLNDLPERQALDIVLRGVPGYMAVDRAATAPGASRYDRLVLLPRTTTPAVAAAAPVATPAAPAPSRAFTPPQAADPAQAAPDRADVDQFAETEAPEPPMPGSPVINPYPGANSEAPGPYGGNAAAAGAAVGVGVQPPETQFDYANPQRYFERMRQQQLQQQQPGGVPANTPPVYPGGFPAAAQPPGARPSVPTATPTAPGTLARPGIAPVPTQPPANGGQFFNPYNLPPNYVPPTGPTPPPGSNVEPDRSKYANPYVPTKPPGN